MGHLKESGVDATWLSPIFKSPMVDFGYDISDFTDIQDEYGTMEDFEALIKEANKLGKFLFTMSSHNKQTKQILFSYKYLCGGQVDQNSSQSSLY